MKFYSITVSLLIAAILSVACSPTDQDNAQTQSVPDEQAQAAQQKNDSFNIDFEQFKLDNGLNVLLHVDRSDPVVAVALTAHVGSAREKMGRTGFAHLFEHLLFLESENLGKGGLDKMSSRIGGSGANG